MSTVKRYQIELNTPQAERWQQVIDDFRPLFPQIRSTLRALLQAQGYTWYFQMMCRGGILMYSRNQIMYANEIQSIATALEMRFDEILVMQFVYELNSACTSIVMTSTNQDERQMFRTMDWDLELLKRLTIEVEYLRDGVPLYVCSSWFGFVGCLTGLTYETMNDQIRVPAYAIAVNFRRTQPMTLSLILQNVARTLALHWPVSYLVRNVLGSVFEPLVIVRSKEGCDNVKYASALSDSAISYLVQTNCDDEETVRDADNILYSRERVAFTEQIMSNGRVSMNEICEQLQAYPIYNEETVYRTMINLTTQTLQTHVID